MLDRKMRPLGFRGLYTQRGSVAMGAHRILGGVKHGIKFLGRANNFARQLGVNNYF